MELDILREAAVAGSQGHAYKCEFPSTYIEAFPIIGEFP
jgi:hypothetical protein